jgi:hypothetical protein
MILRGDPLLLGGRLFRLRSDHVVAWRDASLESGA